MKILMLLTDGFGGFGGISKFNRDFLEALSRSPAVDRVFVWPRLIPEAIGVPLPEAVVYERKFARGKLTYIFHMAVELVIGPPIDIVVCGHIHLLGAAWLIAKARRARLALVIHGIEAWRPTKKPWLNWLVGRIDALISVSRLSALRFSAWSHAPAALWIILPNCVDIDAFTPGPKSPVLLSRYGFDGARVAMTLGRLESRERYKGFDEVLEVMPELLRRFPDFKYLIVGDGSDRMRIELKARTLGVADSVVFAGRLPESEKVEHYRLADVYVMPSSGEGFGIVLIEAAACGVPVVGSTIDGSREALLDGRLGRLVDPSEPRELVAAICEVLSEAPSPRRNALVETFDRAAFNGRVARWLTTLV